MLICEEGLNSFSFFLKSCDIIFVKMEKYRVKVTPIVYLMLTKENNILLLRRYNTGFHDGLYSFPAGHVEQGEGLIQAVIREGREEIGIESKLEDLNLVHVMHLDGVRIGFLFRTEKWEGET